MPSPSAPLAQHALVRSPFDTVVLWLSMASPSAPLAQHVVVDGPSDILHI